MFFLLCTLVLFEVVHVYSHIHHGSGAIQVTMIHLIAYLILFLYVYILFQTFGFVRRSRSYGIVGCLLFILDLWSFLHRWPFVWYMSTLVMMFVLVFLLYFSQLNIPQRRLSRLILLCALLILLLFWNESLHCTSLLRWNAYLPYHAIIETIGLVLFIVLPSFFLSLAPPLRSTKLPYPKKKGKKTKPYYLLVYPFSPSDFRERRERKESRWMMS